MAKNSVELQQAFGFIHKVELYFYKVLSFIMPKGATIINIGAGVGTTALALLEERPDLAPTFYTVDIEANGNGNGSLENERTAFINADLPVNHHQVLCDSKKPPQSLLDTIIKSGIDLLSIDGDHSYDGCYGDISVWYSHVKPGGWMVIHDYQPAFDEVIRAVDVAERKLLGDFERMFLVDTLIVFRKKKTEQVL